MKAKLWSWVKRYSPAEISGTLGAIVAGGWILWLTDNAILAAYAGSMGENMGFYGVMIAKKTLNDHRKAKSEARRYNQKDALMTARNLFIEFGPAEILDSFLIRPLMMGLGMHYLGQNFGLVTGKIVADLLFYLPTIVAYELRKKKLN